MCAPEKTMPRRNWACCARRRITVSLAEDSGRGLPPNRRHDEAQKTQDPCDRAAASSSDSARAAAPDCEDAQSEADSTPWSLEGSHVSVNSSYRNGSLTSSYCESSLNLSAYPLSEASNDSHRNFWRPPFLPGNFGSDASKDSSASSESPDLSPRNDRTDYPGGNQAASSGEAPGTEADLISIGSVNHPTGCSPCVFFVAKSRCSSGNRCCFCHLPHSLQAPRRARLFRE
ncbi:unnamed protein product, partial [Symbiodinium sp. CCMP2456]